MKVILQQDVAGQGKRGALVEVSDGYARNYLFPRKLASEATPDALNSFKLAEKAKVENLAKEKQRATELAEKLKTCHVVVHAKCGTGGRLFGSVTNAEVVAALNEQFSVKLDKHDIALADSIKQCGTYTIKAKLGHGISAEMSVEVKPVE